MTLIVTFVMTFVMTFILVRRAASWLWSDAVEAIRKAFRKNFRESFTKLPRLNVHRKHIYPKMYILLCIIIYNMIIHYEARLSEPCEGLFTVRVVTTK